MTPEQKIWEILQIIHDARKLSLTGKLSQYDARKIDPVVARDDHEQIFDKLETDEKVIQIHTRPDYINEAHYRFYILPGFDHLYAKYKQLNQDRANRVVAGKSKGSETTPDKKSDKIEEIVIVRTSRSSVIWIVINKDYQHYIKCDPNKHVWGTFVRIAEGEDLTYIESDHKQVIDYLSNPKNRLYTHSKLQPTKLLSIENGIVRPTVSVEIIDETRYKRRLNQKQGA